MVQIHNLLVVLLTEIQDHRNRGAGLSLFKLASRRTHVESDVAHFVSLVMTVASHDDGALEFIVDGFLDFLLGGWFVGVTRSLVGEPTGLLLDELEAVVNRKILADVVNDEVKTTLKDPG